jgi:molybdopterin-guanine dinucleotide biosynthesis protein A
MTERGSTGVSGIVLAGGQSERMGRDKALMELGGQTLIARVLDRLSPLCDELIISAKEVDLYQDLAAQVVADLLSVPGPLSGIHAGLVAMRSDSAIVVACDMPFLNLPLLRFMSTIALGFDVVVPRIDGNFEPLHAVYRASCIEPIEQVLADGPQRVVALYERVRVREIHESEVELFDAKRSFFNVNTPADWERALRLDARDE